MKIDSLKLNAKQLELVNFLQSKELINEILHKLLGNSNHELVQKPRLHFDSSPRSKTKYENLEKENQVDIEKVNHEYDEFNDEDEYLDFQDAYPRALDNLFRRDTFLTGGAVAAIIFEKLTGTKAVINDIDLFFYHYKSKDQSDAEQERYNNLSGEEKAYHIKKVKEVGLLNLVQINLEDNFTWWSVLDSFDLNYSQVGINLAEKEIIFTKNFIEFLEKKVIELVPDFDQEYPLTSYLRGVHKSQDFQVPFYARDLMQKYLSDSLGSIVFGDKDLVLPVSTTEKDNGEEFVTEKRFKYWLKNPNILPYMIPEEIPESEKKKEGTGFQIKVQLPEEPWVGLVDTIYQVYNRTNQHEIGSTAMLSKLIKIVPNFYNLRPKVALRLKQLMQFKLFSSKIDYSNQDTDLINVIKKYPEILSKDISVKKVTNIENFLNSHPDFVQSINFELVNKGVSIDEILDFVSSLSKLELTLVGILETALDKRAGVQRHDLDCDDLKTMVLNRDFNGIKKILEEVYKRRLEKNRVVPEEQKLLIKPFARWVSELIQHDQLIIEGKNMNHCVGGYGDKVKRNESRIFHIQMGKNDSTLEVGLYITKHFPKNKQKKSTAKPIKNKKTTSAAKSVDILQEYTINFQILQHRAKYNGNPHKSNQKVAELLIKYLNDNFNRNQKWVLNILNNHISTDNQVIKWPYIKI